MLATNVESGMLTTRERVSVNTALSWRNHQGLTDIESFLEEEGIGGSP